MDMKFQEDSCLVRLEDGVLCISFNRPQFGNSLTLETYVQLTALFKQAADNPEVRVIVLRGEGKVFAAGGDIDSFSRLIEKEPEDRRAYFTGRLPALKALTEAIVGFEKPVVVAVRGAVAGAGLLYPLAADIVIGEPGTTFVFAHQRMGLSPDGGVTWLLPRSVGSRAARRLLLTAAKVEADEALQLGLLDEIVVTEMLDEQTLKIARRLARAPQMALRRAKSLLAAGANAASLEEQLDRESAAIVTCFGEDDFVEGVRAFVEKRSPSFPSAN